MHHEVEFWTSTASPLSAAHQLTSTLSRCGCAMQLKVDLEVLRVITDVLNEIISGEPPLQEKGSAAAGALSGGFNYRKQNRSGESVD